ncbi:hypothetical protein ABPG74_010582 [Tetrahymena malaccensis]
MSQNLLKLIDNYQENREHQQCAIYLINKVDINPNYHPLNEDDEVTLLMKAAEKQMVQVVKLLLQKNEIQVNKTDKRGETALVHSVKCQKLSGNHHLSVIELLLEHGADPNAKYIDTSKGGGEMPLLHACVINQWSDIINLLIKYKIDINSRDKQGDTATHIAARKQKRIDILEMLISCNPDLKIQNNNHQTALDVAYEDKKKLIQSKIHEQEEKLRQQQLEDQKLNQIKQAEQQIKDIKQDEQKNNIEEKQPVQNQIEQVQDLSDEKTKLLTATNATTITNTTTDSIINNEAAQESEQKSKQIIQNTQQNQTVQQNQQQANYKSEDEGKTKNNNQSKDQKESGQENGNINGQQQQQLGQNNSNTGSSLQSKKQLNQASTEFQLNSQQASQSSSSSSSQQNNASNNLINQNQQNNFSSPTQSFNSMQNIKANNNNNNLNSSINSQNNINKNPQYGSQYQNYSGQQHLDRSKNLPNQQIQQGQISANLNRGNSNFNYPQQKSPISQVGIPNQSIMPGLNGSHQQFAQPLQKNQIQTPVPQNQLQNSQQLQQTPSPSNINEEYSFQQEYIKLYELMKTQIITKLTPNKIQIDISDDSKKSDLNLKAQLISFFVNTDKIMNQFINENKDYKMKNQQLEQENQSLKQKYEDLIRLRDPKYFDSEIPNQIDPQQTTNTHKQSNNNKDPFNCANDILDWDQDLVFRKHGDPMINYFKSTQMLSKKELIPHLNQEIREFEREVNEYNKRMEPTFDELIRKVEDIIKQNFPNIKLNKYGSYATKLCLPWSDIDIAVDISGINKEDANQSFLKTIEVLLFAHSDLVQEILNVQNTSVPVLKVTCTQKYDYKKLDITILEGKHNGIKCVDLVNNYINAYQHLKPLVLVLKQFLHSLEMNDTYKGGLSSYSLILMLVYFIQQKQSTDDLPDNEAELLIQFLLFYGFDEQKAKYITPKKVDSNGEMDMSQSPNIQNMNNYAFQNYTTDQKIHIMDPQNYSNNVARSSFHYNKIKTAMACSYTIMHTMYVCHSCKNQREMKESQKKPCLILKRLFYLPGKIMDIQDAWVIHPIQQQQFPFYNQYAPFS